MNMIDWIGGRSFCVRVKLSQDRRCGRGSCEVIGRVKFRRLGEVWRPQLARGTERRCTAPRRKGKIEKCHREL